MHAHRREQAVTRTDLCFTSRSCWIQGTSSLAPYARTLRSSSQTQLDRQPDRARYCSVQVALILLLSNGKTTLCWNCCTVLGCSHIQSHQGYQGYLALPNEIVFFFGSHLLFFLSGFVCRQVPQHFSASGADGSAHVHGQPRAIGSLAPRCVWRVLPIFLVPCDSDVQRNVQFQWASTG